ncbi:MAG: NAD-dependent epimerase [Bacteroidales bacterium]|nr:NAD-dependent epimerase [Bacteroidales bacterium]
MKVLVTGTAGFIGYHLANRLLKEGHEVIGLDNINDYYDVNLKYARLEEAGIQKGQISYNTCILSLVYPGYRFIQMNLEDRENLFTLFREEKFDCVCNLAAQAGVRYSLTNPYAYIDSNIVGFINILEACRHNNIQYLVYASSSSVYGLNESIPFSEKDNVDHPISLYAATKKSNELMAHTYSYLYGLPTTGVRFFTVYGPWGRPDMALFIFTKAILEGKPIQVFNNGEMERDFTYIDDIVEGIFRILTSEPPQGNISWHGKEPDPSSSPAPYKIYNIGNSQPVKLMDFIRVIEEFTGKKAIIEFKPLQAGDVRKTWANVQALEKQYEYRPHITVSEGIKRFVKWYNQFYLIKSTCLYDEDFYN